MPRGGSRTRGDQPDGPDFINKVEAARRQIDAAVRTTFSNEDDLAIHTVAQAAYRILRDLLDKRGRSEMEEIYALGIFHTARALADGDLPQKALDDLKSSEATFKLFSSVAESIKTGGEAFTADNVKAQHHAERQQQADRHE